MNKTVQGIFLNDHEKLFIVSEEKRQNMKITIEENILEDMLVEKEDKDLQSIMQASQNVDVQVLSGSCRSP